MDRCDLGVSGVSVVSGGGMIISLGMKAAFGTSEVAGGGEIVAIGSLFILPVKTGLPCAAWASTDRCGVHGLKEQYLGPKEVRRGTKTRYLGKKVRYLGAKPKRCN